MADLDSDCILKQTFLVHNQDIEDEKVTRLPSHPLNNKITREPQTQIALKRLKIGTRHMSPNLIKI